MEILDSPVNVRHGGSTLAVIGAAMFRLARVSGGQDVEIQGRVRSGSARPVPRGNERHVIEFEVGAIGEDIEAAAKAAAAWPAALPRGRDFATVTTSDDSGIRLHDAVIVEWPAGHEASVGRHAARIVGGRLEAWTIPPPEPEIVFDGASGLIHRIVTDSGEKFFEVGFRAPSNDLLGNAADGWMDAGGNLLFRLERSEDLATWDHEWIECPTSPESNGDGAYNYFGRMRYPLDSAVKTAQLVCSSTAFDGDSRNNPFTGITIAGVAQSLPNFPYTMPGDAAQLQTDLVAAGWTGATVSAASNVVWEIVIPGVTTSSYGNNSKVTWPGYTVSGPVGSSTINGRAFDGEWLNASGGRTRVQKQFARMGVSAGPNYQF